jgi:hypothetical protein
MIYYLTHLKDVISNNYLGIDIHKESIQPFLNDLSDIIGDEYVKYTEYQEKRDLGHYHITVINVMEYNSLSKNMGMDKFVNSLDSLFKYEIDDLKMMGVGTAERNGNRAYFIVCQSEKLNAIRQRYNLGKLDFHITLGFFHRDVFGVPKNIVIDKKSKFIKFLKTDYYKNYTNRYIR